MSVLRGILFNRVPQLTITQGPLLLASGQLRLPNGTAVAPSLAFSSETTLGWYRYAAGFLGLSAGKNLWLPNGSTVFARNFADNSNKSLLYLNGSDKLILGEGGVDLLMGSDNNQDIGASGVNRPRTGYFGTSIVAPSILFSSSYGIRVTGATLTLDAGSLDVNSLAIGPLPATIGTVRLANGTTIQARNAANTANIIAVGVDVQNQVTLGPSENVIAGPGFLSIGTNPSMVGELRLPNTGLISSRNAANNGNLSIASINAANLLLIGESGLAGITLDKAVTASSTMTIASTLSAQGGSNGQALNVKSLTESTTIAAAATTDTAIQIPANVVVLAVSARVTTVIPTAATFSVTGATSATTFSTAAISTAAGSTDVGTASTPYRNGAAQTIRITPNLAPAAATGVVRVTIHYYDVTPPTS